MGNAAYKILLNIILGKIKPNVEKVMGSIRMDLEMEDLKLRTYVH
jgi:hypothetical protein